VSLGQAKRGKPHDAASPAWRATVRRRYLDRIDKFDVRGTKGTTHMDGLVRHEQRSALWLGHDDRVQRFMCKAHSAATGRGLTTAAALAPTLVGVFQRSSPPAGGPRSAQSSLTRPSQTDSGTSAAPGRFDRRDVDPSHLHHRLESALGCGGVRIGDRGGEGAWRDLPRQAPLVLAPAAGPS
jgi:hypothetical protein